MSDIETKDVMQAVKELRETVEASKIDGLDEAKMEQINTFLDTQEKHNLTVTADLQKAVKSEQELKEYVKELEKKMAAPSNSDAAKEEVKANHAAFVNYAIKGFDQLDGVEQKLLRTSDDTNGGFLIEPEFVREIIKEIIEISPMRSVARVRQTTKNEVQIPRRTAQLNGDWVGESSQDALSNSTYGMEKVPVHKIQVTVDTTHEQLRDASFNMESEVFADATEDFARIEGLAFVLGTGSSTQPQGFLTNPDVGEFNTGAAASLTADSIVEIAGEVKTGYNLSYLLNRRTIAKVRTLKAGDGHYLWVPGLAAGNPNTINGLSYLETPDMPDIGANAFPIAIGDWFRGYTVVDNINMEMIRDDVSRKRNGIVEFTFFKRVGGQVVLTEAIKKLKIAV